MILQPLVENAVIHGVEKHSSVGVISISSSVLGGRLRLIVRNSGRIVEEDDPRSPGNGIGLANTRERLEKLYGDEYSFELKRGADGEFAATLVIPPVQFDEQTTE
jgi:LytS/YehU family sensor histidine kinase